MNYGTFRSLGQSVLGRKQIPQIFEGLELECVSGRIEKKHGGLFAWFSQESNVGSNDELSVFLSQTLGELLPDIPFQDDSEMGNRDTMAIDIIGAICGGAGLFGDLVSHNLVAEKIKINPAITAASHRAAKFCHIKVSGRGQIVDRKRQVEWAE